MQEPHQPHGRVPGPSDPAYPTGQTESFETRPYNAPSAQTRQFPPAHAPHSAPQAYSAGPQYPTHEPPMGYTPLAHEGGLAYGNPPAPASPQPQQQFIPQHLAPPQQFAPGPYPPHPQQFHQPYMYPPQQIQQTVVMNNGRRVSHGLHLVLTLITAGLWLPVWIILSIANS